MLHDLRHSLRALTRTKGSTAVILLSLGLGTGVNAAVYGVLSALLLRGPSGVHDSSRIAEIYTAEFSGLAYGLSSYPDYLSVEAETTSFASVAAVDDNTVANLRVGEFVQSARFAQVTVDFFPILQMQPHAGRLLDPSDESRSPTPAVISHALSEQLGGASAAVGQTLIVGEEAYAIVGVTPPRFRGLQAGRECDAWVLMTSPSPARGDRRLTMVGRLSPQATLKDAEEELRRISDHLAAQYPETNRGNIGAAETPRRITPARFSQLDPAVSSRIGLIGIIVGGASLLLLASACLNVGSLLLSRAIARRHELAIKMALGAPRRRLMRQLFVETLCLSLAGGALGLLFAVWTADAIPALFMTEHAELLDTEFQPLLILLTVGVAGLAGALFGVAPAVHGTAAPAVTALRADGGGIAAQPGGGRWRAALVGAQVSLSTLLLLATGLLVMTLTHALEGDAQAPASRVAFVSVELPGRFDDPVRGVAHRDRLLERLPKTGGVEAVGWASTLPLGKGNRRPFRIQGQTSEVMDLVEFETNVVSPEYFRTLSLPCIEGRLFDDRDRTLARPVVIVDELLARRYFGPNAVGQELLDARGERVEIVGVVRTGRYRTLQPAPQPTVYYPFTQDYLWRGHLLVRTASDPAALLDAIDTAVRQAGDGGDILRSATLSTYLAESLALDRVTTTLVGLCGLVALAMSSIGVYGVMADAVRRRTREIGLRMALGASRGRVMRLVFSEVLYLAAAGLLAGTGMAVASTYIAQSFVYGVPSLDIGNFAAAAVALASVVAVASVLPLRRALGVNPNIALRAE